MWQKPSEVPDDSATAHQLTLMETFADGEMTRADFVQEWLVARRLSADNGEQVTGRLEEVLDSVTSEVENYAQDPQPEAEDPSEDPLVDEVNQLRIALDGL
ncbi:hypothetical protein IU485_20645 [Nocardia cyriacigeorgica]|uniref:Uncharacterized protein n=1 Tax=Nocardia cyriacigeorgica (strain GUH-2) TaxID=1127134 RepID=H6QYW3_NOCCG|nr:hypothetical protein [Nocardia cyriacigeorgica]MBF6083783.1 hypothetical protein [Nocardia cyriacigeorgica]MBF6425853.1 hypothetical protein [Nocardia cyriacigeorgica]CCF61518.1 protein of unknown function [Nocardia cyriacigeorgica GUH-2]BDT84939.1 hypothetical protein FMUAM8_07030 [Nocardia cyriacigeorgica]BDU04436.1 hypothetical protein FMUBM48_06990 [Nocardia cyriacigeorgica]